MIERPCCWSLAPPSPWCCLWQKSGTLPEPWGQAPEQRHKGGQEQPGGRETRIPHQSFAYLGFMERDIFVYIILFYLVLTMTSEGDYYPYFTIRKLRLEWNEWCVKTWSSSFRGPPQKNCLDGGQMEWVRKKGGGKCVSLFCNFQGESSKRNHQLKGKIAGSRALRNLEKDPGMVVLSQPVQLNHRAAQAAPQTNYTRLGPGPGMGILEAPWATLH